MGFVKVIVVRKFILNDRQELKLPDYLLISFNLY